MEEKPLTQQNPHRIKKAWKAMQKKEDGEVLGGVCFYQVFCKASLSFKIRHQESFKGIIPLKT